MPCVLRPDPSFHIQQLWERVLHQSFNYNGRAKEQIMRQQQEYRFRDEVQRAVRNGIADGLKQQFDACEELPPELVHLSRLLEARDDGMRLSL
jgi:hypothetical protein